MSTGSAVGRLITALVFAGAATGVQAGSLTVNPVVVTLDDKTHSAALTIKNEGSEVRVIQTELLRWTQKDGADVQTPSRDMLINPPLATLQPGQTQTVRIGLRRQVDNAQELAYRLYLTEIPSPGEHFTGLRIALRLGVPIYVSPKARPDARLGWQATRAPNGALMLTLLNNGNRHLRVDRFKVIDPGTGRELGASRPGPFTLLAGQARRYSLALPAGWAGGRVSMLTTTADGSDETRVEVPGPAT
ncbi:MAG TPA: fimbria/pilus periplasmic chaperone [Gallionellaceae bacterium]